MASPRQNVFWIAAWFGIAYGLLAGAGLQIISFIEPPFSVMGLSAVNAHILWIEPVFDVLLFVLVAGCLATACTLSRRIPPAAAAFAVFSFLTFVGLLILPARFYRLAPIMLALGLTATLMRWLRPRMDQATLFVRRSLVWMVAAVVLIALGTYGADRVVESTAIRSLPSAQGRPNVLLIVLDTVRADRMSLYGHARATTPGLDRFAAEGVTFTQAIATSSWTLPSHASLFTGLYPNAHGANKLALGATHTTLAQAMSRSGFLTAGFAGNASMCQRRTGLARGFLHYVDVFQNPLDASARTVYGRRILPRLAQLWGYHDLLGRRSAAEINSDFLTWLDSSDANNPSRPFFAFLNYFDAHDPYMPPPEFAALFSPDAARITRRKPYIGDQHTPGQFDAALQRVEQDAYDAALRYLDAQLAQLFRGLAERRKLENTLVVITSDHGEAIFEHGRVGHSSNLYREVIHIPLVFRWPGKIPAGMRDSSPVDLTDVAATILGLIGQPTSFPGRNLAAQISATAPAVAGKHSLSELDSLLWYGQWDRVDWMRSLVTSRWHFVQNPDGSAELYDWARDPAELHNLAGTPEGQVVVGELRAQLESQTESKTAAARPVARAPEK